MLVDNMRIVQTLVAALVRHSGRACRQHQLRRDLRRRTGAVDRRDAGGADVAARRHASGARSGARAELRVPLAMLRPTLIYGAADPHNGYGPNRFRRLAAAGKEIVLFGEGEEQRDHVAVGDVAEIAVRVLKQRSYGTLNLASGEVHSFRGIAEIAAARAAKPVAIKSSPRSGPMPHNGYRPFDVLATRTAFPDFRYTPLREGLRLAAPG